MSEIRHAQNNISGMHRWQRRSLIRKIVDELHTLRDDELSDGLFDQSDNLDKLIFNACASVTALAETDDAYFALVLEEFSSLLKTMSDVVRRNAALSAELH
jgi:hypothetical protein